MDVFEKDMFYGKKLHPSKAEYANAAGPSAITTAGAAIQGSGLRQTLKSLSDQEQEKRAKAQGGTGMSKILRASDQKIATQAQAVAPVSEVPAPVPRLSAPAPVPTAPQGPFLGTFQFPQQQYYPQGEGDVQQQGGVSQKTLLYVAVGIAAVGLLIYYKKNNA